MARSNLWAALAALITAGPAVLLAGCSTEAFCFNCEGPRGGAAGSGGSGQAGAGQGGNGGSVVVVGGNAGAAGNDCNADLETDPQNCGECGNVCKIAGSNPTCSGGKCVLDCAAGFYDLNKDASDGCEYACTPSNGGVELCDDVDNNCDGLVDEDVDTSGNINHCGACKSPCILANAVPTCAKGACQIAECLPGFTDLDKDPKNGCEYACGVSNGGVEICDGLDNDCNNVVDDPDKVDTSGDPKNCGACGVSCDGKFASAVPTCQGGQCVLGACLDGYLDKNKDPSDGCEYSCQSQCNFPFATGVCQPDGSCAFGQCLFGYHDLNKDASDGCEYACTPTGDSELCDGKDNNCDGQVDEGFDLTSDPANCGSCGKRCDVLFPNATVACQEQSGQPTCVFTGCKPGFFDGDGNNANGCEYDCTPSGPEVCDGLDNDCDGIPDNPPNGVFDPPLPEQCDPSASVGACQSKTLCQGGQPTCVQVVSPSTEVCDGVDNNCDGNVDEGPLPQVGIPCGTSQVGECKFGTTVCQNGSIQCQGQVNPKPETCNGKDDNCNGLVDDSPTDVGGACGSNVGACKPGVQQCLGGALTCVGDVKPAVEVCDGPANTSDAAFDNNCNGQVNEGCAFPLAGITRLDTLNSTQGQHSSFQLSGASADSDFLVAYADGRSGGGDIYGRASTNAGTSWGNNDFLIAGEGNVEVEPHVFLRSGRAYVAYSRFEGGIRRIYVRSANSPYTTWSAGVRVDGAPNTTVDCYGPQGVVAKAGATPAQDFIAVLWSEIAGTQAAPTRNIYLRFSKDGGATYGATSLVNSGAGADKGELPVIASNGNGIVYVAWRDKRTAGLAQTYVGRIDLNLANPTFTGVTALQPNAANASAEQIVIAADTGNNAYVGWVDLRPPKKTIRVAYTNNAGVAWSNTNGATAGVVNLDSTFADANAPSLAARGGRVVAAWEDTRSGATDIRVNFSTDAGKTWQASSARADTGDGLGATASLTPRVAFGQNDSVFVTWQDLRFPSSAVLANVSIDLGGNFHPDAGATFRMDINSGNPAAGAAADSQYPLILASPLVNRAAVVWIDFRNSSGNNGVNGDIWTRTLQLPTPQGRRPALAPRPALLQRRQQGLVLFLRVLAPRQRLEGHPQPRVGAGLRRHPQALLDLRRGALPQRQRRPQPQLRGLLRAGEHLVELLRVEGGLPVVAPVEQLPQRAAPLAHRAGAPRQQQPGLLAGAPRQVDLLRLLQPPGHRRPLAVQGQVAAPGAHRAAVPQQEGHPVRLHRPVPDLREGQERRRQVLLDLHPVGADGQPRRRQERLHRTPQQPEQQRRQVEHPHDEHIPLEQTQELRQPHHRRDGPRVSDPRPHQVQQRRQEVRGPELELDRPLPRVQPRLGQEPPRLLRRCPSQPQHVACPGLQLQPLRPQPPRPQPLPRDLLPPPPLLQHQLLAGHAGLSLACGPRDLQQPPQQRQRRRREEGHASRQAQDLPHPGEAQQQPRRHEQERRQEQPSRYPEQGRLDPFQLPGAPPVLHRLPRLVRFRHAPRVPPPPPAGKPPLHRRSPPGRYGCSGE
jgi:hypothetical protein